MRRLLASGRRLLHQTLNFVLSNIKTMHFSDQRIPYRISDYINEHFREDFLFEVKSIKEEKGHTFYTIEVSKDDYIHVLRFNEDGQLLKEETDPAFPLDEEQGFGEVPE